MKVYNHYVEPERYPAFNRRKTRVITHDALDNRVQFSASRFFTADKATNRLVGIDEKLRMYTETHQVGKCFWLHWKNFFADNFEELVQKLKERGLYLYGAWGYIPAVKADMEKVAWGEFPISDEKHNYLMQELGDHFFGYEMGEQDGRYFGAYRSRNDSSSHPKTRAQQKKAFDRYFDRIAHNFHDRMTILCALTVPHYFARGGYATMLSCEAAQALPNPQMWYAFLRGASKQYGILCSGNVSVFNRSGYKNYGERLVSDSGKVGSPEAGTSLSLMRRIFYNEYMYNCDMLGFENSYFCGENSERHIRDLVTVDEAMRELPISPIGTLQEYANHLIDEIGKPGVMHTPVAILMNENAGWLPPRHLYARRLYEVWGNIPYGEGDYQTHALFSMLYPKYENAGFYADERGFLTETPYGEMTDVLLSDVDFAVMERYQVLVIVNGTELTLELFDKLRRFVRNGGKIVICASVVLKAAEKLKPYEPDILAFFGLGEINKKKQMRQTTARYADREYTVNDLSVIETSDVRAQEVIATVGDNPAILRCEHGAGMVDVLLMDSALEPLDAPSTQNEEEHDVFMPFDFSCFVKAYLGNVFEEQAILKPSNRRLQYIVTVKAADTVMLQVTNNTVTAQRYDIVGCAADVKQIREIVIDDGVKTAVGYYPECVTVDPTATEGSGERIIAAGDVAMFEICLSKPLTEMAESNPAAINGRGVRMPANSVSILDFLQDHPTFTEYFDTVLVDAAYFERSETEFLRSEARQLQRLGIHVAVDFTYLFNLFPDLSFDSVFSERYEESYHRVDAILNKIRLYDCNNVLLTSMLPASAGMDKYRQDMHNIYEHIVRAMSNTGARVVFQNRFINQSARTMYQLADGISDLRIGLDVCAAMSAEWDIDELFNTYPIRHISLSAPQRNADGRLYNCAVPVYGTEFADRMRELATSADAETTVFMTAHYQNWDEIYADYRLLFSEE